MTTYKKLVSSLPDDEVIKKLFDDILPWPTINKEGPEVEPL